MAKKEVIEKKIETVEKEDTSEEVIEKEYITNHLVNVRDLKDKVVKTLKKGTKVKGFIQNEKLYLEDNTTIAVKDKVTKNILIKEVK